MKMETAKMDCFVGGRGYRRISIHTDIAMPLTDDMAAPELALLTDVLGDERLAALLATAPRGWRELRGDEVHALGLDERQIRSVIALQILLARSWQPIPREKLLTAEDVARVYGLDLRGSGTRS